MDQVHRRENLARSNDLGTATPILEQLEIEVPRFLAEISALATPKGSYEDSSCRGHGGRAHLQGPATLGARGIARRGVRRSSGDAGVE
jgi:hypothetical protein